MENYKKLIFETEDTSIIILKLGEESNIALFFKKEEEKDLKLSSIKRYIAKIETLIDMSEDEIILEEILSKERELEEAHSLLQLNQEKIHFIHEELKKISDTKSSEQHKSFEKEINFLTEDCTKIEKEIHVIQKEIVNLKHIIEK